ncbi:MAG TPA: uroporphyrinogen-III synthase [Planctomycetota bacterium]|nr:uroporphyrinogen-III synthase [Planctomycetota bacterium]
MRPLEGLRILVTRPRAQAGQLAGPLRRLGARVRVHPAIEIRAPRSWSKVDREIARLDRYDALVFTSVNAVEAFFGRAGKNRALPPTGAVGPATAAALRARGVRPAWVAARFTTAALGRMLRGQVLHPASEPHSPDLAREARRRGAEVVEPVVYRILRPPGSRRPPKVDLVTFASSQTVRNFQEMAGTPREVKCACIGPVTARTARAAGFRVVAQPARYTIPDLISAIVTWHRKRRRS